jgi:hypothetical protein
MNFDIFVRDSFELEPHQFKIKNLDWQIKINMLAKRAFYHMKPSGAEDLEIYAELHKMYLYKKNGHFMRHKDNVLKDKHMFGTLVVQLPSEYTGGEFITFNGLKLTFHDFGQTTGLFNNSALFKTKRLIYFI